MNDWVEELSNLEIGGEYLTIHNAFKYIISIDLGEKPKEVQKTYKGKDAGTRFQFTATLFNLEIIDKELASELKEEKPDKFEKIMNMEAGEEKVLELPKGATKEFAKFIKEKDLTSKQLIALTRSGEGWQTEYNFRLANEEELGY
jgi:hypothetical protein